MTIARKAFAVGAAAGVARGRRSRHRLRTPGPRLEIRQSTSRTGSWPDRAGARHDIENRIAACNERRLHTQHPDTQAIRSIGAFSTSPEPEQEGTTSESDIRQDAGAFRPATCSCQAVSDEVRQRCCGDHGRDRPGNTRSCGDCVRIDRRRGGLVCADPSGAARRRHAQYAIAQRSPGGSRRCWCLHRHPSSSQSAVCHYSFAVWLLPGGRPALEHCCVLSDCSSRLHWRPGDYRCRPSDCGRRLYRRGCPRGHPADGV